MRKVKSSDLDYIEYCKQYVDVENSVIRVCKEDYSIVDFYLMKPKERKELFLAELSNDIIRRENIIKSAYRRLEAEC